MMRDLPLTRDTGLVALSALIAACVLAPLVYICLVRLKSRQTISEFVPEHAAKQGTPTMGGLSIVLAMCTAWIVFPNAVNMNVVIVFLWFALIGFLDDFVVPRFLKGKRGLGWLPKLGLQVLPFAVFCFQEPSLMWFTLFTGFVVLFFANAYNFADGIDGLAASLGILLALTFAYVPALPGGRSIVQPSGSMVPTMAALALAITPFLLMNWHPAKIFMGDVGSLPIGALLGFGFVAAAGVDRYYPTVNNLDLLSPVLLVMLIEIVPGPLQIASAKLRKGKRLFPFRTPVHHAFQAAGWPETRIVGLFLAAQLIASIIVVFLFNQKEPWIP